MGLKEWSEDQVTRDDQGRFSSGGGGSDGGKALKKWAGRHAEPLVNKVEKEGGFSYRPAAEKNSRVPKTGFMISRPVSEKLGHVIEMSEYATKPNLTRADVHKDIKERVTKWLETALPAIEKLGPDHFLGGWTEQNDKGETSFHFDVSQNFKKEDRERALATGRERNQVEVWDLDTMTGVKTGGTGRE